MYPLKNFSMMTLEQTIAFYVKGIPLEYFQQPWANYYNATKFT